MISYTRLHRGSLDRVNETLLPIDKTDVQAYFPFWENGGSTTYDESKNGRDGTISGATWTWLSSFAKPGLSFDGTDDVVNMGDTLDLAGTDATLIAWVNTDNITNSQSVIWKNNGYLLDLDFGGQKVTDTIWFGTFGDAYNSNVLSWSTGTWYQIVCVWDSSTNTAYFYRNGTSVGSESGTEPIDSTTTDLEFGYDTGASTHHPWDGLIGQVLIYNRQLSGAEIAGIYEKTKP